MLRRKASLLVSFLIAALVVIFCVIPAVAGEGDGTGGGQGNPLTLVSSSLADGQKDVSLSPQMTLTFSKNVVNMSVKDNNQNCFTLSSANGIQIPIKVTMADDQMEPEKKQIIVVSPATKLSPGTQYILKILPGLTSKSGVTLGQTVSINFYTEKTAGKESPGGSGKVVEGGAAGSASTVQGGANTTNKPSPQTTSLAPTVSAPVDKESQADSQDNDSNVQVTDTAKEPAKLGDAGLANNDSQVPAAAIDETSEQTEGNGVKYVLAGLLIVVIIAAVFTYFKIKRR